MIKNFHQINIRADASILYTLKYMDEVEGKLLLVTENDNYHVLP